MSKPVYMERRGEVAVITLNRPGKLNALNREIWRGIKGFCEEIAGDPAVKVMVLRGATPRAFASGADIAEFPVVHATPQTAKEYHGEIRQAYDAVANLEKPTIALIQGICFGGGCAIALCCDLRYADATASFCIPPARLGLVYSLHETKRLADLVGPSKAKEMLMGAKVIQAEEALQCGLVTRLFAPEEVERETFAFADELAGLSQTTIRGVKKMVNLIAHGVVDDTPETKALSAAAFESPDYREGRDSFLQKRKPRFTVR
jgi:enoyl-CoA hydratase